jgi:hypothetical protein
MHVDHLGDRRERAQRIDHHLRIEVLVGGHVAHRRHEERVAVGVGARRGLGADGAARPGAVLDHHSLAPDIGEARREEAGDDVGASAGREGDDDLHGLGWESVRRSPQQNQEQ